MCSMSTRQHIWHSTSKYTSYTNYIKVNTKLEVNTKLQAIHTTFLRNIKLKVTTTKEVNTKQ